MFESHYNDEMAVEVRRIEARKRATDAGHPEWLNACEVCQCKLENSTMKRCDRCK